MPENQALHPVHAVYDGLFNTSSGKIVNLRNPQEDVIDIMDIANALSKLCRFGGHCNQFYSVAQHSVIVAAMAPEEIKREALFHDAAEAYLGDVIKPLKVLLGGAYSTLEHAFESAISNKFGLNYSPEVKAEIKRIDNHLLVLEHEAFQKGNVMPLLKSMMDMNLCITTNPEWDCNVSYTVFVTAYAEYFHQITLQ